MTCEEYWHNYWGNDMIFWFLSLKVFHSLIREGLVLLLGQTCQSFCENLGSDHFTKSHSANSLLPSFFLLCISYERWRFFKNQTLKAEEKPCLLVIVLILFWYSLSWLHPVFICPSLTFVVLTRLSGLPCLIFWVI